MLQEYKAQYFLRSGSSVGTVSTRLGEVTLVDNDLVRGNGTTETATTSFTATGPEFEIFNGYTEFVLTGLSLDSVVRQFEDGEVSTSVTFTDGTTLEGVLGFQDFASGAYGSFTEWFLLDQSALAAVGKTMADVADIDVTARVDHSLNWDDFGFTPTGVNVPDPEPEPEPEPDPILTLLEGTAGNNRLIGTAADELIIGRGDDDRLTGGAGADTFVFGGEARDGDRDRDIITDFRSGEDTILFEAGASIRFIEVRNGNLHIQLNGDRDMIIVQNADQGAVASFVFSDDLAFV